MKKITFLLMLVSASVFAQTASETKPEETVAKKIVKAACGKCVFKMKGMKKCCLAVEIDGKLFPVEGSAMENHGNSHAADGLCRTTRNAEVSGKIADNKFLAYDFKLLPVDIKEVPLMEEKESPALEDRL